MRTSQYFFLFVFVILCRCAQPKLTNNDRGSYTYKEVSEPEKILSVNVTILPLPTPAKKVEEKEKTFFDLRDSIPQTFLRVIGSKATKPDDIINAIKSPLSTLSNTPTKPTTFISDDEIKIRLLFSNIKKYYNDQDLLHPNTRLEFLNTKVVIKGKYVSIVSIDRIENEFEQIDMGTLSRDQSVNFSTKLNLDGSVGATAEQLSSDNNSTNQTGKVSSTQSVYDENGKLIGTVTDSNDQTALSGNTKSRKLVANNSASTKAEIQYANNESIKEALAVRYKKMKTGFTFTRESITVSQRGRPLSDISDNIVVTATIKVNNSSDTRLDVKKVTKYDGLFAADKSPNPVKNIKTTDILVQYAPCHSATDISLDVSYEGVIRAVKNQKKGRNVLEYDDQVVYNKFTKTNADKATIPMMTYCHDVFKVVGIDASKVEYVLNLNTGTDNEVLIYDDHEAGDVQKWLLSLLALQDATKFDSATKLVFISVDGTKRIDVSKAGFNNTDLTSLSLIKNISLRVRKENML
ncbi:MAG: hypothetical protein KF846_13675 [Cyclobacteriaceae bacterium]|nr:hypothetical protein [Cyclobacteriaceae bacterium]MBX2957207.1 hypothetical protein [Cyclobacteriaceae bacterium]